MEREAGSCALVIHSSAGLRLRASTLIRLLYGRIPALQEDTWQEQGTHVVKKKLDLYDHLAMLVGPRPDTVTSDNLRSSRTESDCRLFNPGSPVDMDTNAPVTPVIPQSTGRSLTPEQTYDVSARNSPPPPPQALLPDRAVLSSIASGCIRH